MILAEVPELVGAEHLLAARATEPVAAKLYELIERVEARARAMHVDMRYGNPRKATSRAASRRSKRNRSARPTKAARRRCARSWSTPSDRANAA